MSNSVTPWTAAHQASLSFTVSQSLLKFISMLSNSLILYCPLFLVPSVFPSISVFSNESALHLRWPKYWSFSFSIISPSKEYSGLISFKIDWFDLLVVQGTLESFPQHHSWKASILWCHWKNHSWLYRPLSAKWCLCFYCPSPHLQSLCPEQSGGTHTSDICLSDYSFAQLAWLPVPILSLVRLNL